MKYLRLSSWLLFSVFLLPMIWSSASHGRGFRLALLPDEGGNWACATCHTNPAGGGPRNAFGQDYEAIALPAGDVYTVELGQRDSDGDGISNDDEFNANPPTEPWNPDSPEPIATAVEAHGKVLMMWARLKSISSESRLNRNTRSRPTAPVQLKAMRITRTIRAQQKKDKATAESSRRVKSQQSKRVTVPQSVAKSLEWINAKTVDKRNKP